MKSQIKLLKVLSVVGLIMGQNAMAASFLDTLAGSYSVKKETCAMLNDESTSTLGQASIVKVQENTVVVMPVLIGQLQSEYSNTFQPGNGNVVISEGWEGDIVKSWVKRTLKWQTDESKLVAKKIETEIVGLIFKSKNRVESRLEVIPGTRNVRLSVDGVSCELVRK